MVDNEILLLLQYSSLMVAILLLVVLVLFKVHQHNTSVGYETARWMIMSGMVLFIVHFVMQMYFGFRAKSDVQGSLINILFYSPVAYLIAFATIRMSCGRQYLTRYIITCGISMVLIIACFLGGWFYYGSLEMPMALNVMEEVFALTIITIIFMTFRELQRVRRLVEDETAVDMRYYDVYMRVGTILLYAAGLFVPIAIISNAVLALFAPVFLLSLIFYIVSFISLGFNIASVGEIIDEVTQSSDNEPAEASETENAAEGEERLTPQQIEKIEALLAQWRAKRGFSVISLNSSSLAERLGIPKKQLSQYLSEHEGKTFRVWLSDLRIEEVKQLLLDNKDYSNEAIAAECGFSSRSWMQEKFKATTGLTPNEWREKKLKAMEVE